MNTKYSFTILKKTQMIMLGDFLLVRSLLFFLPTKKADYH